MSYKQIAERLVISHRTVQNHVQNTLRKLQMHNRVELTRYAIAQGLDDDADAGSSGSPTSCTAWRCRSSRRRGTRAKEPKASDACSRPGSRLRKPSTAAWVVNLLVRQESEQVTQVLQAGPRCARRRPASPARSQRAPPGSVDSSRPPSRTAPARWRPRTGRR